MDAVAIGIGGFTVMTRGGALGGILYVLVVVPIAFGPNWVAAKLAHHGRGLMARSACHLIAVDPLSWMECPLRASDPRTGPWRSLSCKQRRLHKLPLSVSLA